MPKGFYKRTPGLKRTLTEADREKFRENMKKARAASLKCARTKEAQSRNAATAGAVRRARGVLRHLPLDTKAGDTLKMSKCRMLTVVDALPAKRIWTDGNGVEHTEWEMKFLQNGRIKVYGLEHVFSGKCRIVWDYEPTRENIMYRPRFESDAGEKETDGGKTTE